MTDAYIAIPKPQVKEGSSFTATAYFRSGSAAATPSTARYRVDCLATGTVLKDWTDLSVSTSISIAITSTFNAIQNSGNARERKQLVISADYGTDSETRDQAEWMVENLDNIP